MLGLIVSIGLFFAFKFFFKVEKGSFFFWLLISSVIISALRVLPAAISLIITQNALSKLKTGPALLVDNYGLSFEGNRPIAWQQLTSLEVNPSWRVPGANLVASWQADQPIKLPLISLDIPLADLDSALRAFSAGRYGLQLTKVARPFGDLVP